MKILQLKFKNINSLKGEHCINFEEEPLKSNSLFAITGPTGSGKSTLLDVICLALFNEIPRMGRVSKSELSKTGAVITRHQKSAYAQVVYQSNAGRFLSHWDIQYNRNQNLNDYEMRLKNLDTNQELDLKKSEIPKENEKFIGLTYSQFIKSILLAQGDFAKFLKADDSERKQLLEQITGTDIYRKIGIKAFEKASLVKNEIDKDKQRLSDIKEDLLTQEEVVTHEENLNNQQKEKQKLEQQKIEISKQEELYLSLNQLEEQLKQVQLKQEKTKKRLSEFEKANAPKIELHLRTQAFGEELQEWRNATHQQIDIQRKKEALQQEQKQTFTEKTNLLERANDLLPNPSSWKKATTDLEEFRVRVIEVKSKIKEVLSTFTTNYSLLIQQAKNEDIQLETKNPDELKNKLHELQTSWKENLENLNKNIRFFPFIEANAEAKAKQLSNFISSAIEAKTKEEQLRKLIDKEKAMKAQMVELRKKTEAISPLLKHYQLAHENATYKLDNLQLKLNNFNLTAELAVHRHDLEEGKACPLCGATSHPFAKETLDNTQKSKLATEISQQKQIKKETETKYRETDKELSTLQNLRSSTQQTSREIEQEIEVAQEFLHHLDSTLLQFKQDISWEQCISKLTTIQEAFQQKNSLEKILQQSKAWEGIIKRLKELTDEGLKLRATETSLYKGDDIDQKVNALKSSIDRTTEKEKSFEIQISKIETEHQHQQKIVLDLTHQLKAKVEKADFKSIEEALNARLNEVEFQRLQEQRQALQREAEQSELQSKNLQQQKEEVQQRISITNHDELQENYLKISASLKHVEEEIQWLTTKLRNQEEKITKIKHIEERIKELSAKNEKWLLLNDIIGDKNGKKFNDFAQDLSLKYLLGMANKRLFQLSKRYQIDRPSTEESKDLMIIDHDMGSERRSVKTLSGGETFVVSLALALALSDMASQNVRINSLFIDEGFGTLDPETLDQTLDTLERLQAETNKTIGIISHVDALKERIQTQIQLQKNGQGYSILQVVAT